MPYSTYAEEADGSMGSGSDGAQSSPPQSDESMQDYEELPRKLAVLGLPWDTSEDTLRLHFSQFGVLESGEVMKDRYSGKSRGFGFVTFVDPKSAQRALGAEHTIDGRQCQAKIALPKGDAAPARTTRIFIARIPASVTEQQFRGYFERFGKVQDAYMPKDYAKQGYRGIGFVTFASADSVEKVVASKHTLNGHEVAIDRATPKEDTALRSSLARLNGTGQRRSFDNGAGIVGPGLTPLVNYAALQGLAAAAPFGLDALAYPHPGRLSEDHARGLGAAMVANGLEGLGFRDAMVVAPGSPSRLPGLPGLPGIDELDKDMASRSPQPHLAAMAAMGGHGAMDGLSFAKAQAALNASAVGGFSLSAGMGGFNHNAFSTLGQETLLQTAMNSGLNGNSGYLRDVMGLAGAMHPLIAGAQKKLEQVNRRSFDNPSIANARAGPRIFVGKLTKDTSEADVKEYFMRFGFVMDVYMPKAKDNKAEHRGFGFVTFETEAAIQRVVAAGTHRLKGSTVAIDIAVPKMEEDAAMDAAVSGVPGGGFGGGDAMAAASLAAAGMNPFALGPLMMANRM